MIKITLSNELQIQAAEDGLLRAIRYIPQFEGLTAKRNYQRDKERLNFPEFVLQQTEAIGAEWAVAQYFNQPIERGDKKFKNQADVGSRIEVKWTKWIDGHLILTDLDRKEDIAILVTGKAPVYYLAGWIPIAVARRERQKRSDGSWWIAQADLHPIENLSRSVHGHQVSLPN